MLAILFLAVVVPTAVALVWLGARFVELDEGLVRRREVQRREISAQAAAIALERSLASTESWFAGGPLPEHAVRLTASVSGVRAEPLERALWLPGAPRLTPAATREFDDIELLEFRGQERQALERYEALTSSASVTVRAGALLRVARVQRRQRRLDAAAVAYRRLATVTDVAIEGTPADLLARRSLCAVLEEAGRHDQLKRESAALAADFASGRWMLDRAAWELSESQIAVWTAQPVRRPADKALVSAVADWLDDERRELARDASPGTRLLVVVEDVPVTLLIHRSRAEVVTAVAVFPPLVEEWLREASRTVGGTGDSFSLVTGSGAQIAGTLPQPGAGRVTLAAAVSGLPWTLVLTSTDGSPQASQLRTRRQLLLGGLAALVLLLAAGSIMLWHVVRRELAVATLQTNFVAAVSHEFRTPLASLRHVTELLEEDDRLPPERRRTFYQMLGRNTERLHRLVESLLDFARMEDGRKPYDLQRVDLVELAASVVDEFRQDARAGGFVIDFDAPQAPAYSQADAPSLTHALWNLLDNAVKYSPARRAIRVSIERNRTGVAIAVRDAGIGIARGEQHDIFRRFVRGRQATRLGIKGTGLGLAMVDHIVRAHGGAIELESEEGVGSTFRVVLPEVV